MSVSAWQKPAHLQGDAAAAWDHVVRLLTEAGTLEITDPVLVETYAVNVQALRDAHRAIAGKGLVVKGRFDRDEVHPATNVINTASMRIKGIVEALGLCPATSRFSAAKTHGKPESDDKWDGLLGVVGA